MVKSDVAADAIKPTTNPVTPAASYPFASVSRHQLKQQNLPDWTIGDVTKPQPETQKAIKLACKTGTKLVLNYQLFIAQLDKLYLYQPITHLCNV